MWRRGGPDPAEPDPRQWASDRDPGMNAYGGAIFIAAGGSLTASYTVFIGNQVVGGDGGRKLGGGGFGGAIRNQGVANLDHDTFSANQALGGATRNPSGKGIGGYGFGGAVASGNLGTLTVSNCRFSDNKASAGLCRRPSAWVMVAGPAVQLTFRAPPGSLTARSPTIRRLAGRRRGRGWRFWRRRRRQRQRPPGPEPRLYHPTLRVQP